MLFIQKDMNAALRNSARGDANRFFAGAFAMSTGAMRESHDDT
jgi:chorismate synthase